jgi:hypothetical protein
LTAIPNIKDFKVRRTPTSGDATVWEVFSLLETKKQGKVAGFGPGLVIPRGTLVAKHGLGLLKLPSGSASISFPELGDIEGTAIRSNPGPLLSREQKKEASEKIAVTKASRVENKAEMASIAAAETTAAFSSSRLSCPRCPAKFTSPKRFENHEKSDCGRYAKAILRRKIHDAGTIRARMRRNDDDLAEEAEMLEEEGLDIVRVFFPATTRLYGWTLEAKRDETNDAPPSHSGLEWMSPTDAGSVAVGAKVRVSGKCFEEEAKLKFGSLWAECFFYGVIANRSFSSSRGACFAIHYHGETEAVESHHISQFQVGSGAEVAVLSTRPAVVASVVPGGAASQELVAVGFEIVSVDGITCPDFTAAFNALTVATTRRLNVVPDGPKRGTTVQLRRPCPTMVPRGKYREPCTRPRTFDWAEEVVVEYEKIVVQPAFKRRDGRVLIELKKKFGAKVDAEGKCMCPSRKDVTNRMLSDFRKKKKKERDDAQDSAARKLAQAARAAGVGADSESEYDVVTDGDDDETDDDSEVRENDNGTADKSTFTSHLAQFSSVKVSELRRLLKEHGKSELATVKAADLLPGLPTTGPSKSDAVRSLLCTRLARVLADEDETEEP